MTARWWSRASGSRGSGPPPALDSIGPYCPLKSGTGGSEGVVRDIFIYMDGLGVLSEIVEAGEFSLAVALEGSLAGMFSRRG